MEREQGIQVLKSGGWLAGTPPAFGDRLLSLARWRSFAPGRIVTLGGEEGRDIIGLAQGTVLLTTSLGEAETPMLHMAHAVLWMGYVPFLVGARRRVTVVARTQVWCASIPNQRLHALLAETPGWWRHFLPLLAQYGDIAALIASDLLIRRSDRRVAATILRFAGLRSPAGASGTSLFLPVAQAELAEACNLSRTVVGEVLHGFAGRGWIGIEYRGIAVHDPDGLRRFLADVHVEAGPGGRLRAGPRGDGRA